jgi:hypothetical protein
MNFAEQNAENRNSLLHPHPRFIIRVRNIINGTRRCSFCNQTGHNITSCNDYRLDCFRDLCFLNKEIVNTTNEPRRNFKQWLMNYYIIYSEVVKAFAISKCHCRLNSLPELIIEKITNYIFQQEELPLYQEEEKEEEEKEEESLPDYIPFTERNYTAIQALLVLLSLDTYENNRNKFNINTNIQPLNLDQVEETCECTICYEDDLRGKNFITLNCNHKFCKNCFKDCLKHTPLSQQIPTCALCRTEISSIVVHDESVKNELNDLITHIN